MLEENLSYPGWGERWTGRFLIGSTMWLLGSVLFVPTLALYGYFMRALGASARGEDRPPQRTDYTRLVIEGLRAIVVSFVYGSFRT